MQGLRSSRVESAAEDTLERQIAFVTSNLPAAERFVRSQPAYASLRFVALDPTSWRDTYLDTDSWAVWRGGFSLAMRHRADGAEVALEALAGREGDAGTEDLNAYSQDETAAGSVSERVKLLAGGAALHTVLEMETKRSPFSVVREDEEVARLYLDASTVHMGEGETVALHRVEVEETVAGGLVHLGPFLQAMEAACAGTAPGRAGLDAGLRVRRAVAGCDDRRVRLRHPAPVLHELPAPRAGHTPGRGRGGAARHARGNASDAGGDEHLQDGATASVRDAAGGAEVDRGGAGRGAGP
jgi:hypothetical protein